jgi:Predicted pyridoxal phosphate-dependent enzyme apparently involved in regulation of cell wall biogenesis
MALYFALKAVGVKVGDEVIVPALDWYAATAATLHLGAIPVFADTEPNLPTISPLSVQERITVRTNAIVATHLFGYPCNMPALPTPTRPGNPFGLFPTPHRPIPFLSPRLLAI